MSQTLPAPLVTEMDSLSRSPASKLTVEKFFPEWVEAQVGGSVNYAHGHSAAVAIDGNGAGEDILFRCRVTITGDLEVAIIKGNDIDDATTWESLYTTSPISGIVPPHWTSNIPPNTGGSLAAVWSGDDFRVFAFTTSGFLYYFDFDYDGLSLGGSPIVTMDVDEAMQLGATSADEVFLIRHDVVEYNTTGWQDPVYGTKIYRWSSGTPWTLDTSEFLFHTHAEGHLVKDGPLYTSGSTGVINQWGTRPCGGLGVVEIDTDTVLVSLGMRHYHRKSYDTHTQAITGFLYHRDNGLWERVFDNDEADFDSDNQLWLDVFVRGFTIEDRKVLTWVRLSEPSDFEQQNNDLAIPRTVEAVYARALPSGRWLTQAQYLGDPKHLSASTIVALNHNSSKSLYALGYTAILHSDPAYFLCDVPDAQKLDMDVYLSGYTIRRDNNWSMSVRTSMVDVQARILGDFMEGYLIRVSQGIEGNLVQIGQGHIDKSVPSLSVEGREHSGPINSRAELLLLHTKAESVDDIFPLDFLTIEPKSNSSSQPDMEETETGITVTHPSGISYHNGWWLVANPNWPNYFFPNAYTDIQFVRPVYRMESWPWAFTGGGPVDLPPGVYGGPGDVADPRKLNKRGTFFNDIVWLVIEPRIDGAVQSSVRFGDDKLIGNFAGVAENGQSVSGSISRTNGLITNIVWGPGSWNDVKQESVMAGLICRSVRDENDPDGTGKKYLFCWEANSDFNAGSHLEDQAGTYWASLVFDKPNYGTFPIGQNKLYLYISDFDETDSDWIASGAFTHQAIAYSEATGLTTGKPADLKMQVLGGTIYCFYRPYFTDGNPRELWRHAITYNAGHFGAGRFGMVGRGHSGIQWDVLYPLRNAIDLTDNVVDFWNIEATDAVRDYNLEEVIEKYAWQGLTETEFRSEVDDAGPRVIASGEAYNGYGSSPFENPCVDFTVNIDADGGEAGLVLRSLSNATLGDDAIYIGIVVNGDYKEVNNLLNVYVVKRRYAGAEEVIASRDYSPIPLHLKPSTDYRVRVSVRNDMFNVYVEGNYVGHFHDDTELGSAWGLYAINEQATFTNIRLPELHMVPEHALLDSNQSMFDAIKRLIGKRHIKGVFRPDGKLLVSLFKDHDDGPDFEDSLTQSTLQQTDQFYSVIEVVGAYVRATFSSTILLPRGRHFFQINNPDLMTVEDCYIEAKLICTEMAERMVQIGVTGPPDLRLEPEDVCEIIISQQSVTGDWLANDVTITFDLARMTSSMQVSCRRVTTV